jgi:hypothetical protein
MDLQLRKHHVCKGPICTPAEIVAGGTLIDHIVDHIVEWSKDARLSKKTDWRPTAQTKAQILRANCFTRAARIRVSNTATNGESKQ